MLKALVMASVIIGAFLFNPAHSQTAPPADFNPCPLGGTFSNIEGVDLCLVPAPTGQLFYFSGNGETGSPADSLSKAAANFASKFNTSNSSTGTDGQCTYTTTTTTTGSFLRFTNTTTALFGVSTTSTTKYNPPSDPSINCPVDRTSDGFSDFYGHATSLSEAPYCPPADKPMFSTLTKSGELSFCSMPASVPSNDDECPPETVGGCEPPQTECFIGGNGLEVCPSDPDEKCTSYEHNGNTFYDCEKNCGFIEDKFFCTKDPEIPELPDLSRCIKVASGFACPPDSPTPEPDDTLDEPEKPISNMVKGDFKQANRGIETRLDATNDLLTNLNALNAANNQALTDLNAKQLASNGFLRDIKQNTASTAQSLEEINDSLKGDALEIAEDSPQSILSGLGLTGNEKFSDLEKEVVSLDSYRDEFTWSVGSSSCPPDRSMSVLGSTFTIAWQPYCDAFSVLGHFIQAAAFLFSAFIAFGVRK